MLALTHLNLDVRSLALAERFYGELLGLPIERKGATLRICHPAYLLVLNEGEPHVGGTFHFGFRVPERADVDTWIARLRAANVPILAEPGDAGSVYVARVADPDGYHIEIYTDA